MISKKTQEVKKDDCLNCNTLHYESNQNYFVECRVTFYTAVAIMRPLSNPCPLIEKILQLPHC